MKPGIVRPVAPSGRVAAPESPQRMAMNDARGTTALRRPRERARVRATNRRRRSASRPAILGEPVGDGEGPDVAQELSEGGHGGSLGLESSSATNPLYS